jgi:hypothetical protein
MALQLPTVAGVIKVEPHWTYGTDGNVMSHLFYDTAAATPGTSDLLAFITLFATQYNSQINNRAHPTVALRKVRGIWLGDYTSAVPEWNGNYTGSALGAALPAQTACLINLHISRRYRGGHPRLYWPLGSAIDIADPQHWSSSFLTAVTTGINAMNTALQGFTSPTINNPTLTNVSYYHGNGLRTTPLKDPVATLSVNGTPGSQRRRIRP